jgi:hypothetical protein
VLAAGGIENETNTITAELYDPATGKWRPTGSMTVARAAHTATLLRNGKVLVAGGSEGVIAFSSAELFDPAREMWTRTGDMTQQRRAHTATLLASGRVLIAGGGSPAGGILSSAELYDSATGMWTMTGDMTNPRRGHTATRLVSGNVLVAGGAESGMLDSGILSSAELYDPASGKWTAAGALHESPNLSFDSPPTNWPSYTGELSGVLELRVKNPNDFKVRVALRSERKGKDFIVQANSIESVHVPDGRYSVYFHYSTDPDGLYQGDGFTLENRGAEITITKVVNGNYNIRKVK